MMEIAKVRMVEIEEWGLKQSERNGLIDSYPAIDATISRTSYVRYDITFLHEPMTIRALD